MRRHLVHAPLGDGLDDRHLARAVQPGLVRQVRGAERSVARACGSVTRNADFAIGFLAPGGTQAVVGQPGQRHHVVRDVLGLLLAERGAQGRHDANAAVRDGSLDDLRLAAIEPVLVGQVRESLAAAGIRRMALGAMVEEQLLADRARGRVGGERLQVGARVFLELRPEFLFGRGDLLFELADLRPAQRARVASEPGVKVEIAECERDGDVEEPHPPRGQRVVVLAEIAVPGVARGLAGGCALAGYLARALHFEEHRAGHDRDDRERRDVDIPETAGELAHLRSSSSKTMRASLSKRSLRDGP